MAYSKESNAQKQAMNQFNEGHWEKKLDCLEACDLKYTNGEMNNPENLKKSNDALASYVRKNKMDY